MSLNSTIRAVVNVANSVTASLQGTVLHSAWIRQDAMGTPVYGRKLEGLDIYGAYNAVGVQIPRQAVIEKKQRIREVQGRQIMTFATLTFVGQVEKNGMTTFRKEPFDPRDILILPDGDTGPIIDVVGVLDSETNNFYAVEVFLGDSQRIGNQ
jgi:hypothetical protein